MAAQDPNNQVQNQNQNQVPPQVQPPVNQVPTGGEVNIANTQAPPPVPPPPPPQGGTPTNVPNTQQRPVVEETGKPVVPSVATEKKEQNVTNNQTDNTASTPVVETTNTSAQSQVGDNVPPKPKKSFPKKLLLIPILLILMGGIAFAVIRFGGNLFNRGGSSGSGELVWWGLWEDESIIQPLIQEYEKEHPEVTIKYERQSKEDYRERLNNALARGEGPDIFRIHNTWVPMFDEELDTLPSSVMSAGEYSETFYPVVASDMTSGSGLVGIPLGIDTLGLYINEDIFESFGKTPPTTWDEFRRTAIELTVPGPNNTILQSGAALGITENVDHWQEILGLMMNQNGVRLSNPTGPRAEAAINYYTTFARQDKVWDNTLPPSTVAFANGTLAMYFGPSWRAFEIAQQNPDLRFKVVPVPQLPKGDPPQADINYATYWVESVWSRSKNKDIAWDFLKFLSSKDSLEKIYLNAAQTRLFGEPYPRSDMEDLLIGEPYVGAFVSQAPTSTSWFLASRTFDGETGINSEISAYFEDAVNSVASGGADAAKALETAAIGVNQVLTKHKLTTTRN